MGTDSAAPALDGGLSILEALADRPEGMGFNELVVMLPQSKATVVRLLKVLSLRGYVLKDSSTGRYGLGLQLARYATGQALNESLARMAQPVLQDLSDKLANTALLFAYNGERYQSIAKVMHPASVVMQEVGGHSVGISDPPWSWLFCIEQAERRGMSPLEYAKTKGVTAEPVLGGIAAAIQQGYAYDDSVRWPGIRRLAVLIEAAGNRCLGALALGGTTFSIVEEEIPTYIKIMRRAAGTIADLWTP